MATYQAGLISLMADQIQQNHKKSACGYIIALIRSITANNKIYINKQELLSYLTKDFLL